MRDRLVARVDTKPNAKQAVLPAVSRLSVGHEWRILQGT